MGEFVTYPIPAPTGGLNLIDRLDAPEGRPIEDARELKNVYPLGPIAHVRLGTSLHLTLRDDVSGAAHTLTLADGTESLIVANDLLLLDCTTNPEVDVTGSTTPTSNEWQGAVMRHRLFLANGADTVQVWDGTTMADSTFSGVTLSTLINVSVYKERLFFVQKNTTKIWYGGVNVIGGAALTVADYQDALKLGGYIVYAGSFTNSYGDISRQLFMIASSEGELLFYQGTHPGDTTTPWALVARFRIGKPVGYRAFVEVDNDVWCITDGGIMPVSLLFSGVSTVSANNIARKINPLIAQQAKEVPFSYLWHGAYWGRGRRVYISLPITANTAKYLVCNLDNGAWCTYEFRIGTPYAIAIFDGSPFLALDDALLVRAETGQSDAGGLIDFDIKLPFAYYGARQQYKSFKEVRALFRSRRGARFSIGMQTDFRDSGELSTINTAVGTYTPWGSDWGSSWSSPTEYIYDWVGVRGQGHTGAIRITGSIADAPLEFSNFDVRYEAGVQR